MAPPRVYLAGPDGFTVAGLAWHRDVVIPAVAGAGLEAVSPWAGVPAPGGPLGAGAGPDPLPVGDYRARNAELGRANAEAIRASAGVLALLDGVDVDSGTAAEIGFAAALSLPVVGLRTDSRRSGDNPGAVVNLQVEYFVGLRGGRVCTGLTEAVALLARLVGAPLPG